MLPTPISFDDYANAVRQAKVSFVATRRAVKPWWLEYYRGATTEIQFGSDGSGSIADGIVADGYALIARHLPSTALICLNGDVLAPGELAILPPGGHFIFSADGPRTWFSFLLTPEVVAGLAKRHPRLAERLRLKQPSIVTSRPELMQSLLRNAEELRAHYRAEIESDLPSLEGRIMDVARDILSEDAGVSRAELDRQALKSLEIVSRALLMLQAHDTLENPYVDDLARAAQVHPRTLLRAFHRVMGMGPIRYLKLRQLNAIRRTLVVSAGTGTVTEVMFAAGASDLGRVSAAYGALFGELPSETMRAASCKQKPQ